MVTDGDVAIKNRVKEFLRGAAAPKVKRHGRDSFFFSGIAVIALVSLTAISYRPSGSGGNVREDISPPILRFPSADRFPLAYSVRVVLTPGREFYLDERTAAMLGVIRTARADESSHVVTGDIHD